MGEHRGLISLSLFREKGIGLSVPAMDGSVRMSNRMSVVGGPDGMVPWILQWLACRLSRNERLEVGALGAMVSTSRIRSLDLSCSKLVVSQQELGWWILVERPTLRQVLGVVVTFTKK